METDDDNSENDLNNEDQVHYCCIDSVDARYGEMDVFVKYFDILTLRFGATGDCGCNRWSLKKGRS